jgi:hypothetical protein
MPQQQPSGFYPPTIFMDQEFRTRILLSLQSSLPNEIDWAFNTLIKFSYASENFCLDFIPALMDFLLDFTVDFFQLQLNSSEDLFCSKSKQEAYERVLQVFHIVRNFSFLEMNIRRLALHERLRFLLMKGIALSPSSQYGELSRHCLDILENIAPQVSLVSRDDPYFTTMTQLLFSNDRAFILGAIRALTRVAVTETNERVLGFADLDVIGRMAQFLMVDDEELEAAALEYLYQYSSLRGSNFSTQLVKCYPGNLIGLLTGFLSYKSSLAPPSSTAIGTIHGIPAAQMRSDLAAASAAAGAAGGEQPSIPDLTNYSHLDEPYRCLGWLKDQLITGGEQDIIILKDVFGEYQKLFGNEKPLGMKEFYTVLKIAFPQPPAVEESFNNSGTALETVLQHVKYSPTRRRDGKFGGVCVCVFCVLGTNFCVLTTGPVCHWNECNESFDSTVELHKHIIHQHLSTEEQQSCQWMKCNKKDLKKGQAIHHLRTHFTTDGNKVTKKQKPKPFTVPKIPTDDSEVSGIPLTSALLLRNLARYKQHHSFYMPYESELTLLAIQRPKVSKYILTVLGELQA